MTGASSTAGPPISVLVVDDDPDMCWALKIILELSGHCATLARSGHEALELAVRSAFPVAFVDARLPDMDGIQLGTKLVHLHTTMKVIIISGYYSEDDLSIVEAVRALRVHGFLAKPFQIEAIEAVLARMTPLVRGA